jgi:proline dehydrogenase
MLRDTLLYLSNQPRVFNYVRHSRLAKHFAKRFVPGETLDEALEVVRTLNARGITASLDLLGESVTNEREARAARDEYLQILDRIHQSRLDANVSVKLTAMGLDIDHELCVVVMQDILARAQQYESFVRIDMEASAYTDITLKLFEERFFPTYKANVGVVLQSYLYRTFADVEHMNALRARVRICKGAYKEPPAVAYPEKKDVDAAYARLVERSLTAGGFTAIATHDESLLEHAMSFADDNDIPRTRFQFQMLYGVRGKLQLDLVRQGYDVLVATPYGPDWYRYLMRRLAERPANVLFIVKNSIRR